MSNKLMLTILAVAVVATAQTTVPGDSSLPAIRPEKTAVGQPAAAPFFDYKTGLEELRRQIDSLKAVVAVYEKQSALPPVDEKLLELVPIPENQQRIILQNGTVVVGTITDESPREISLQTSLGRLVIRKDLVVRVDENYGQHARVQIVGEPRIEAFPEREIITGTVKNVGQKRADFVRVIGSLWTSSTASAGCDSAFVAGRRVKYESGVISDTALEPGQSAAFRVVVPILPGSAVSYRTQDVRWTETD